MDDQDQTLKAKKNLIAIDEYLQVLKRARKAVELLKNRSIRTDCHKRAISATTALKGLNELISDLEYGQSLFMDVLAARKIPITVERKLRLVINH